MSSSTTNVNNESHTSGGDSGHHKLNDEDVVWRYMPFTKYVDFLRTCSIFCARADKFEDPTEGEWVAQLRLLADDEIWVQNRDTVFARRLLVEKLRSSGAKTKEDIARCVDEVVQSKYGWTLQISDDDYDFKTYSESPDELIESIEDGDLPLYEDVWEDRVNGSSLPKLVEEVARLKCSAFVNCWHLASDQNIAMWKLYGAGNEAVAIRSTVGKLRKLIEGNLAYLKENKLQGSVKRVSYVDKATIEENPENLVGQIAPGDIFFPLTVKHSAYAYENEVRLILLNKGTASGKKTTATGHLLKVCEKPPQLIDFVDAVYLNPMLSPSNWFCKLIAYQHFLHGLPEKLCIHEQIATDFTKS